MSKSKRLEGVSYVGFDLDGTLYKTTEETQGIIRSTIHSRLAGSLNIPFEEAARKFEEEFPKTDSGSKTMAALLGISREEAIEIMQDYLSEADITGFLSYDSELRELFDNLRKGKILITSSKRFRAVRILQKLGLSELDFNLRTYKDSSGPSDKSSGEVYRYYRERLGLQHHASRFVYVGDSEKRDIIPAKQVGFRTVFVGGESELADRSIPTIYDLESII